MFRGILSLCVRRFIHLFFWVGHLAHRVSPPARCRFNPTLVPLGLAASHRRGVPRAVFQSHFGSIGADYLGILKVVGYKFQSHFGSIGAC